MESSGELMSRVREMINKEVIDWDDEVVASSRFKAFSGQSSDWEAKYFFWRDLILKVARHFRFLIIRPSDLKTQWFVRPGGLTPLCLDHFLFLMYNGGDIIGSGDLMDPKRSGQIFNRLSRLRHLMSRWTNTPDIQLHNYFLVTSLLKDKAAEVVDNLTNSHWTSTCIVTLRKFQNTCGGSEEASAVLSYLSGCGKARYLSMNKNGFLEGVKVSLSAATVSIISNLDFDVLHLISTTEKLRQQLDIMDQHCEMSRKSALASLNSGNKKVALRHARELKMVTGSREKCATLLNRVEEVLNVISDAESTKMVTEAIKIGAQAMKENRVNVEEVQVSLQELEENIDSLNQVQSALESAASCTDVEDEDIEEEFKKLELELGSNSTQVCIPKSQLINAAGEPEVFASADTFCDAFSNFNLDDDPVKELTSHASTAPVGNNKMENLEAESA